MWSRLLLLGALASTLALGLVSHAGAHDEGSCADPVDRWARARIAQLEAENAELRREDLFVRAELDQLLERMAALEIEARVAREARRPEIGRAPGAAARIR